MTLNNIHDACVRYGAMLTFGLGLAACASAPSRTAEPSLEQATAQRLDDLERRMQRLEGRPPVQEPYRSREEVQAHIKTLETERARLLVKYTDQHPVVRDIDRRLLILNEQLQKLAP